METNVIPTYYIASSRIIGTLFDTVFLKFQHASLISDSLHFGFKPNSSTVICTSLLRYTIEYYNENGSDYYLLLFDASKAFDRVEYVRVFCTHSEIEYTRLNVGVCYDQVKLFLQNNYLIYYYLFIGHGCIEAFCCMCVWTLSIVWYTFIALILLHNQCA